MLSLQHNFVNWRPTTKLKTEQIRCGCNGQTFVLDLSKLTYHAQGTEAQFHKPHFLHWLAQQPTEQDTEPFQWRKSQTLKGWRLGSRVVPAPACHLFHFIVYQGAPKYMCVQSHATLSNCLALAFLHIALPIAHICETWAIRTNNCEHLTQVY